MDLISILRFHKWNVPLVPKERTERKLFQDEKELSLPKTKEKEKRKKRKKQENEPAPLKISSCTQTKLHRLERGTVMRMHSSRDSRIGDPKHGETLSVNPLIQRERERERDGTRRKKVYRRNFINISRLLRMVFHSTISSIFPLPPLCARNRAKESRFNSRAHGVSKNGPVYLSGFRADTLVGPGRRKRPIDFDNFTADRPHRPDWLPKIKKKKKKKKKGEKDREGEKKKIPGTQTERKRRDERTDVRTRERWAVIVHRERYNCDEKERANWLQSDNVSARNKRHRYASATFNKLFDGS